jgi:hypothetical protein
VRQGLDYERRKEHKVVIGTEQGRGEGEGNITTMLIIRVQDTNDMAPEFTRLPPG